MDELIQLVGSVPYYRWQHLREQQVSEADRSSLDSAAERVQGAWGEDDRREQIRLAVVAAASDLILATTAKANTELVDRLEAARGALNAITELAQKSAA